MSAQAKELPKKALLALQAGSFADPHSILGDHEVSKGLWQIRVRRPLASAVTAIRANGTRLEMSHIGSGIWQTSARGRRQPYRIEAVYSDGSTWQSEDPYRFPPSLGEVDLYLIGEGRHELLWDVLGANPLAIEGVHGFSFSVWAPNSKAVRVTGDFNSWDGAQHSMRRLGGSGVWEIFIPDVEANSAYKFELLTEDGNWTQRADPLAKWAEIPPATASKTFDSSFEWTDQDWLSRRSDRSDLEPMSIYEVHLGSWRPGLDYRNAAVELADYVNELGFSHVEFLPLAEHPFGGSWGYQVTGYYAPTSRFGNPDDFRFLVDTLHNAGIGVILDWVPAHFPKDEWALANFDGAPLYEYSDPLIGEHPDWGTLVFDYGRREVRNFLVANALYWLEEFHVDGLRVDAVASMLYLDYSRPDGQWRPNRFGGRENLAAIAFLQEVTATAYRRNPGSMIIAEDSTAFPGVTSSTDSGGLGFGFKWNMGWMHDSLDYFKHDPMYRSYHHEELVHSLSFAFSENYVLPISHDEVVHGKGSLLTRMPGDHWHQLANLRAFLAYQWSYPGKKLLFMGQEFGQPAEWSEEHGLEWWILDQPSHKAIQSFVGTLNRKYASLPALWNRDRDTGGFQWISRNDSTRNLYAFLRWSSVGEPIAVAMNLSGIDVHSFNLGLPYPGLWREVLNSDSSEFGGAGLSVATEARATDVNTTGLGETEQANSIFAARAEVTLPALSVRWFAFEPRSN